VGGEPAASVALHRKVIDLGALPLVDARITCVAKAENVKRPTIGEQRLRFAPHAWILGKVTVHDEASSPPSAFHGITTPLFQSMPASKSAGLELNVVRWPSISVVGSASTQFLRGGQCVS